MSPAYALNIWRSIRTTFVLFLVVVPLVILTNLQDDDGVGSTWDELALPAVGLILVAGLFAEIGRRLMNHFAGTPICTWTPRA
ncbi:hypothetical protein N6L26_02165 [Qipengyuania sp. SS22]|uniref:hypothetical protein n=1 Tax=Qipengyuania sp. SS22 TaxID=2979461 RepID=UPI0021E59A46|nr:hypothetical protein [Qipengyuania sp. SS22]UYH55394.1 hypothetical protein N6L26_02165 [Qipengyuania sp. SS22]